MRNEGIVLNFETLTDSECWSGDFCIFCYKHFCILGGWHGELAQYFKFCNIFRLGYSQDLPKNFTFKVYFMSNTVFRPGILAALPLMLMIAPGALRIKIPLRLNPSPSARLTKLGVRWVERFRATRRERRGWKGAGEIELVSLPWGTRDFHPSPGNLNWMEVLSFITIERIRRPTPCCSLSVHTHSSIP